MPTLEEEQDAKTTVTATPEESVATVAVEEPTEAETKKTVENEKRRRFVANMSR